MLEWLAWGSWHRKSHLLLLHLKLGQNLHQCRQYLLMLRSGVELWLHELGILWCESHVLMLWKLCSEDRVDRLRLVKLLLLRMLVQHAHLLLVLPVQLLLGMMSYVDHLLHRFLFVARWLHIRVLVLGGLLWLLLFKLQR